MHWFVSPCGKAGFLCHVGRRVFKTGGSISSLVFVELVLGSVAIITSVTVVIYRHLMKLKFKVAV